MAQHTWSSGWRHLCKTGRHGKCQAVRWRMNTSVLDLPLVKRRQRKTKSKWTGKKQGNVSNSKPKCGARSQIKDGKLEETDCWLCCRAQCAPAKCRCVKQPCGHVTYTGCSPSYQNTDCPLRSEFEITNTYHFYEAIRILKTDLNLST